MVYVVAQPNSTRLRDLLLVLITLCPLWSCNGLVNQGLLRTLHWDNLRKLRARLIFAAHCLTNCHPSDALIYALLNMMRTLEGTLLAGVQLHEGDGQDVFSMHLVMHERRCLSIHDWGPTTQVRLPRHTLDDAMASILLFLVCRKALAKWGL